MSSESCSSFINREWHEERVKAKELTLGHGSSKTRNGSVSKHRPSSFRMLGWSSSRYGFTSCKKYIWSVVVASSWRIFTTTLLVFCSGTMFWASPSTTCKIWTCHSTNTAAHTTRCLYIFAVFLIPYLWLQCFLVEWHTSNSAVISTTNCRGHCMPYHLLSFFSSWSSHCVYKMFSNKYFYIPPNTTTCLFIYE